MDVKKRLDRLIASLRNEPAEELSEETNLAHDLGLTSIELMELIILIEEEFSIETNDDFFSLNKLSDYGWLISAVRKAIEEENE